VRAAALATPSTRSRRTWRACRHCSARRCERVNVVCGTVTHHVTHHQHPRVAPTYARAAFVCVREACRLRPNAHDVLALDTNGVRALS
jgi:fatty acid desaturase